MNKKICLIGMIVLFVGLSIDANEYIPDFDEFLNSTSLKNQMNTKQDSVIQTLKGDADRLIQAMGEDPSQLVEIASTGWGPFLRKNVWNADPSKKVIRQDCDKRGEHCVDVYQSALTSDELTKKQQEQLASLYKYYAKVTQPVETLQVDIDALQAKKDGIKNTNLQEALNNLLKVARDAQNAFKNSFKKQEQESANFKSLLNEFMPSLQSQRSLEGSLLDIENKIRFAQQVGDDQLVKAYQKVMRQLVAIQSEVVRFKRSNNLQDALKIAKAELATYEKSKSSANERSFSDKINLLQGVVASLEIELRHEIEEMIKEDNEWKKANVKVGELLETHGTAKLAQIQAKEELRDIEMKLQRLENLRNPARSKEIPSIQANIGLMERVIDLLNDKIKEEQVAGSRQDKKVAELVDKLLQKNSSNPSKALTEALAKVGTTNQKPDEKIKNIQNKVEQYKQLNEHEKIVLELNRMVQYENENDPLNIALVQLNKAKAADMQTALENVMAAAFSKAGVSMDKLDIATRQTIATNLKETSDQLIAIVNSPRLTEQQKQMQKQLVVKAMLKNNSLLFASGVTGATVDALKTGNAQTIATDIALNKLINVLVPAESTMPNFDLSAMNYPPVA